LSHDPKAMEAHNYRKDLIHRKGQVPRMTPPNLKYALIGSGRLASHLKHYFSILGIPLSTWSRRDGTPRLETIINADVVMLAVSDQALESFINHPDLQNKMVVHFAGSLYFENAWGLHPLMTFSPRLYDKSFYKTIPFVVDRGLPMKTLFPFFENPVSEIEPAQKTLYHALSNVAANFPALLWVQVFKAFDGALGLSHQMLQPMLTQILENTVRDEEKALAGPLRRKDFETLAKHEKALSSFPALAEINKAWNEWALKLMEKPQ
jgi:2-dehydropantoate 2-reductase